MNKVKFKNPNLARAVIKQIGGIKSFKEQANDIVNHGAMNGFGQFIYYCDTVKFAKKNLEAIKKSLSELASDLGEDMIVMVKNFNCLREMELSQDEIGKSLFTKKGDDYVYNALAWYALEEIATEYVDSLETLFPMIPES